MQKLNLRLPLAILTAILFLYVPTAHGQQKKWPCGMRPKVLRNKSGNPIWIKSDELKGRAIYLVPLSWPSTAQVRNYMGSAIVKVWVDEDGKVRCVNGVKGHPLMQVEAVRAAYRSQFKPWQVKGKSVSIYGELEFSPSN